MSRTTGGSTCRCCSSTTTSTPTWPAASTARTQEIGLSAFHPPAVEGAGKVTDATLEVSYDDGATWKRADLAREGTGSWSATVRIPARVTHLSLRATASDDAGNRVTQEVVRAAGVR